MVNDKKKGSFFTPSDLSRFVCRNLINNIGIEARQLRVLEPSVGHGSFIESLNTKSNPPALLGGL